MDPYDHCQYAEHARAYLFHVHCVWILYPGFFPRGVSWDNEPEKYLGSVVEATEGGNFEYEVLYRSDSEHT